MDRGTGITTRQMQQATHGAVFVWCNSHLDYPKALAEILGRDDLKIVSPLWLEKGWIGIRLRGLVVDHAANLTDGQIRGLEHAQTRVTPND